MAEKDVTPEEGRLLRTLDDGWHEYLSEEGRKYYWNTNTKKMSWKPPRKVKIKDKEKFKFERAISTTSLPASPNDNVGIILRTGVLHIAQLIRGKEKRKWHKCVTTLTSSHFVFRNKKKLEESAGRISLDTAVLRRDHGNDYCLGSLYASIFFRGESSLVGEEWYHAINSVIETVAKLPGKRPASLVEFNSGVYSLNSTGSFAFNPKTIEAMKNALDNSHTAITPKSILKVRFNSDNQLPDVIQEYTDNNSEKELNQDFVTRTKYRPSNTEPMNTKGDSIADRSKQQGFDSFPALEFKFPAPPGWIARWDETTGRYFYEHTVTNQVWASAKREDGAIYFYDISSHRTSWLLPADSRKLPNFSKETDI